MMRKNNLWSWLTDPWEPCALCRGKPGPYSLHEFICMKHHLEEVETAVGGSIRDQAEISRLREQRDRAVQKHDAMVAALRDLQRQDKP